MLKGERVMMLDCPSASLSLIALLWNKEYGERNNDGGRRGEGETCGVSIVCFLSQKEKKVRKRERGKED
jgi:hypothetical protein